MNKDTFKQEIAEFKQQGGDFSFVFGDVRLPVYYREMLGVIGVRMPAHEVFLPVDYRLSMLDNLAMLQDKLLEKYPELVQ
ncbi:MAG: hypothetical protein PUD15_07850 [Prevotella sp.]|uniref:hypothetical protein n=1 Tax=Prevotella sp. AGR2160 TaxID=1280674 RepID=UPI00040F4504|nr:hypothetical protein [Prevotella sp. AGR2160]MDD5862450.1 hypothetical protein [Prevotella sp.]